MSTIINTLQKFYSLPKRYNNIGRFEQKALVEELVEYYYYYQLLIIIKLNHVK
jgi:hypothetical protein